MTTNRLFVALGAVSLVALLLVSACTKSGCISGAADCRTEAPCQKVAFACSETALSVRQLDDQRQRVPGTNALGAVGDYELSNAYTRAVVAGLGHAHYLDPNGGGLTDLVAVDGGVDSLNQMLQIVGVLPSEAAHYTSIEPIEEPGLVGLQLKGTLDGRPDQPIYTRYELRPCDQGIRVRTEVLNGSPDPQLYTLADGFYWSKREPIPFTAEPGAGFRHPSFGLTTIDTVFAKFPFLAASTHNEEASSFSQVSCTDEYLQGFNSDTVSAGGLGRTVVPPRGWLFFERFIAVGAGRDIESANRIALSVREQVLGEKHVTLTGTVERAGALRLHGERETNVVLSLGSLSDPPEKRTPWSHVIPAADGRFSALVPVGKALVVEVHSFGVKQVEKDVAAASADADIGTLTLPSTGKVTISVKAQGSNAPLDAEIFVVPADEATKAATAGTFFGQFGTCAPWLGSPPGGSPACNRILVRSGTATVEVPVGRFHFYAFHGPFWSLSRQTVQVDPSMQALDFTLRSLNQLKPPGTLSADLHVHGAASFDSSIPDFDRVLSFAASDIDVIVSTDHDVVHDYAEIVRQLGLQAQLSTVTGVETTGHIPWLKVPGYIYPLVIGHYNFWPLKYDPALPLNGAPYDELVEPGELFDRAKPLFTASGVIELNHPWSPAEFGRDLGFPRAIFLDCTKDLPGSDDGSNNGVFVRSPKGGFHNHGHDAQEVINGSQADGLLPYRAFWFYMLNQGLLKTGTANSDSHSLVDSTIGMPRNVVWANTQAGPTFDVEVLNAAIKAGRVLGTNGPIITATIEGVPGSGNFGFSPLTPGPGSRVRVTVTAAPWVPVDEVRFVVNGQVVKTVGNLPVPADPFGEDGLQRYSGTVELSELLQSVTTDAWLVVEAGRTLLSASDLGGGLNNVKDGIPDTTDNNGDGVIDSADIAKGQSVGPLNNPPAPGPNDAAFHYAQITDNGYPYAYTNPFLFDRNGNGTFDAPGVKGGRP